MNLTDLFNIPKPEDEDSANGALQLQVLAEKADTQIWAMQQAFAANLRTPAWIGRSTSDLTGITTTNYSVPFDPNGNLLLNAGLSTIYANGLTNGQFMPSDQGSYLFGAYGNFIASGTVNASTIRRQQIAASVPSGPQFTSQHTYMYTDTCVEANNTLGMFLTTSGAFDFQVIPFNPPGRFWWGIFHGNTSSTLTLKAGATFWWAKFSDLAS